MLRVGAGGPGPARQFGVLGSALLLLFLLIDLVSFGAGTNAARLAFAPRDVNVRRAWLTSSTLRLRFDVPPLPLARASTRRSANYLLASSPHSPPRAKIVGGHFYRVRGSEVVGEAHGLPAGIDPSNGLVRFTPGGIYRQYRVYAMSVSLATNAQSLIPNAQETWVVDWIEIDVELGLPQAVGEDHQQRAQRFCRSAAHAFAESLLLNADIAPEYFVTTATQSWAAVKSWGEVIEKSAENGHLFKVTVYRPGLYRISRDQLEEARRQVWGTSAWSPVSPSREWRVYHRGTEVPACGTAEDDALLLVIPQWDIDEEGPAAYWIDVAGKEAGAAPPNRLLPAHGQKTLADASPSVCQYELVAEKFVDYQSRIRPTADVTRWYWKSVAPDRIETLPVTLPDDFAPSDGVELVVYGALSHPRQQLPRLELLAHGESLATAPLTGAQGTATFALRPADLSAGLNELGVRVFYVDDSPEEQRDFLLQKLVFRWKQVPRKAPQTVFRIPLETPSSHGTCFSFPSENGDVLLMGLDAQNPWVGVVPSGQRVIFADAPRGKPLLATRMDAISQPPLIEAITTAPLGLLKPASGADYLAIVYPPLREALQPLLDRRATQGLAVQAIHSTDVFDLFGYGYRNPQALRSFLSYAFYEWPEPAPTYVLLVGEASDYRRDPAEAPSKTQLDMIPTCGALRVDTVHGDHPYACVAGSDTLPDLHVGRLSVATSEELSTAIAKLMRYEDEPAGEWATRALFVTDDNVEFPTVAREILRSASAPPLSVQLFQQSDYRYVPNARVYGKRRSREATAELINRFNAGLAFVNYFGHGGPNIWSHERLLHIMDLPKLAEPTHLPLVACASCDNAWLDYPVPPVNASMGELFVKQPVGGAIAVFAPVSGATPYEHQGLMMHLLEALGRTPLRRAGELADYAKVNYYVDSFSASVPEQYVLVGDPALELKVPRPQGTLTVRPSAIEADKLASLQIVAEGLSDEQTTAVVRVVSLAKNEELLSRPVAVIRGRSSAVLSLNGAPEGAGAVILEWTSERGSLECLTGRFDSVAARVALDEDALAPIAGRVAASTETVVAGVRLFNPTALDDLAAHWRSWLAHPSLHGPVVPFAGGRAVLGAGEAIASRLRWAPKLPRRLIAQATLADNDQRGAYLDFELPRFDDATSVAFAVPWGVRLVTPLDATELDTPTFFCDVWNVGRETIQGAVVTLFRGVEAIAQSQTLAALAPGAKRQMLFVSRQPLPAGETTLSLLIQRRDPQTTDSDLWHTLYEHSSVVRIKRAPDLVLIPESVVTDVPPEGIVARTSIRVRASLRNDGEVPVRNVRLQLMIDDPTTGTEAVMLNDERAGLISEVPAGATIPIEARWENCNEVGSPRVWLVVNGARTVKERDYSNNVALVPPFKVRRLGDFKAVGLDVSSRVANEGTSVTILAGASSDADIPRGPLDVEVGLRNPLTGKSESVRDLIPEIGPMTTTTIAAALPYSTEFTEAYAIVNASKELEELDQGGNELRSPIWPMIDLSARSEGNGRIDLTGDLARVVAYNVSLVPGPALQLNDKFTSSAGMIPADRSWASGGAFVARYPGPDDATDNKWLVAPWLIEAAPKEQCAPVQLRVPIASWQPEVDYDVYLYALASEKYKGGRVTKVEASIENGSTVTLETKSDARASGPQRLYAGRYRSEDPSLDITLAQIAGHGAVIKGVEIVPAVGVVESPVYHFSNAPRAATLTFTDNDRDARHIRYEVRIGKTSQPPAAIDWGEWRVVTDKRVLLGSDYDLLQWRAWMQRSDQSLRPTVKGVEVSE